MDILAPQSLKESFNAVFQDDFIAVKALNDSENAALYFALRISQAVMLLQISA